MKKRMKRPLTAWVLALILAVSAAATLIGCADADEGRTLYTFGDPDALRP